MTNLLQDLRYAVRQFSRTPGLTAVVVLTIALGIGANTALFSVFNGVILNPLPYPHPEQLVALRQSKANFEFGTISYPNFRDWQKDNQTFSSIAVWRINAFGLTGAGEAEQLTGAYVSSDLFPMLGMKPLLGRNFAPGEDEIGAGPIALISEGLWRRKFDSATDILNKGITLDGKSYAVIGVIPASFHSWRGGSSARDVFVPIGQWKNNLLTSRGAGLGISGIGRLKPGVTIEQGRADMAAVTSHLESAFPDTNKGTSAKLIPFKEWMVGGIGSFLLVLLASVGFVLLIACVNVANLLLARSTGRTREFAIRAALGASQNRVVKQLLTESILLAFAGGVLGTLLAALGTGATLAILPTALPRAEEIGLDAHVLLFTAAISLLAGILFGLAPALKMSTPRLQESLKEGGRSVSGSGHRVQGVFIVAEMAMALVLLCGAGLMIRSLIRLWQVDPGFEAHNVLNFGISLPPSLLTAGPDAIRSAFRELDDKFASIPGVQAVSQTWESLPMGGDDEQVFWLEGQPKPASQNDMNWTIGYIVGPDYLKVMGIPLRGGRFFTSQDNEHSPLVAVIDDVLAGKYFPNQNPIGKRIYLNSSDRLVEIIGVVGHVKQWGLDADDTQSLRAEIYLPCMQVPDEYIATAPSGAGVVVRSTAIEATLADIRRVSAQMSSQQVIYGVQTMDSVISDSLAQQRFSMILLTTFAALALLLASIGIYGVISYVVGQRTHEIGIRMALGARRPDILRLVLSGAGRLALIGIAVGLVSAAGLTRLMANLLYGVGPADPLTFIAVPAILISVALLASYLPARRATRVDPMTALRYE